VDYAALNRNRNLAEREREMNTDDRLAKEVWCAAREVVQSILATLN
jgi:hypothetical protein